MASPQLRLFPSYSRILGSPIPEREEENAAPLRKQGTTAIGRFNGLTARHAYLLLTLALAVFAVAPLAYPGYMQVHSGFVPVYNLADLAAKPLNLQWTPTVATAFDPLRADGLLPYYLALPIVWLGGTPVTGVKVVFALGWVLGALGAYWWLHRLLGPAGACLASLVYTYLPYRIVTVYVRGAWGEALCLGLIPLGLAAALGQDERSPRPRQLLVTGFAWLLIGLSQPGLALCAWLCLAGWLLLPPVCERSERTPGAGRGAARRGRRLWSALAALVGLGCAVTLSLSAAAWQTVDGYVHFNDHFLHPAQLLSAYWGFGASRPGWNDGLSLSIGFAAVGLTALSLLLLVQGSGDPRVPPDADAGTDQRRDRSSGAPCRALYTPLITALVLTSFVLSPSAVLWQLSGLKNLLTYPWQLLGLAGLCLSGVAGAAITLERRLAALPMQAALIIITLLASYGLLQPRFTQVEPGSGPRAGWDGHHVLLIDLRAEVGIPPTAAGLPQPTPGRLPLADYGEPRAGDTLHLVINWQATRPFDRDLKMFVHLLDPSERLVSQADPLAGAGADPDTPGSDYPTSRWDPGRLIVTDLPIAIPLDAPPGPYHIALGLYDGQTLERLPVDGSNEGQLVVDVMGQEQTE